MKCCFCGLIVSQSSALLQQVCLSAAWDLASDSESISQTGEGECATHSD